MIAAREIRTADRAAEQHPANEGESGPFMEEDDMAARVAGAVNDRKALAADHDAVTILEPAIGGEGTAMIHAVFRALLLDPRDPEDILALRPLDRNAELRCERGGGAGMIEMAMRHQDALDG